MALIQFSSIECNRNSAMANCLECPWRKGPNCDIEAIDIFNDSNGSRLVKNRQFIKRYIGDAVIAMTFSLFTACKCR